MATASHSAPSLFPLNGVAGDVNLDEMTAAGTVLGDRVAGCYNTTDGVAYHASLFVIKTAGTIQNKTGVDLTGKTLNFIIARPDDRGYFGRER